MFDEKRNHSLIRFGKSHCRMRNWTEVGLLHRQLAIGEVNETYERYIFNKRSKISFYHQVIFELVTIATTAWIPYWWNVCITIGIQQPETQIKLLKERNLELKRAMDICKSAENASTQARAFRPTEIDKVCSLSRRPQRKSNGKPDVERQSKFCGTTHVTKKEKWTQEWCKIMHR